MSKKIIACVYHKDCYDGFAAAWVLNSYFSNQDTVVTFRAAEYKDSFDDIVDYDQVFLLDFSVPPGELTQLCSLNTEVFLFDHHKTAEERLGALKGTIPNLTIIFDMNRSGAGITWDYFYPSTPREKLINYIEDRDLYNNKLPYTQAASAYIRNASFTFEAFELLRLMFDMNFDDVVRHGKTTLTVEDRIVDNIAANAYVFTVAYGEGKTASGYAVNSPVLQTDVCMRLLSMFPDADFAACFAMRPDNTIRWSFRSEDHRVDVSEICKHFGGGGHRNAAGYTA